MLRLLSRPSFAVACVGAVVSLWGAPICAQTPVPTPPAQTAPPAAGQTPPPVTGQTPPLAGQTAAATQAQAPVAPALSDIKGPPQGACTPVCINHIELRFHPENNNPVIDPPTYLYYMKTRGSQFRDPTKPVVWVSYDEDAVLADFKRLWDTHFLDNLWIEVEDEAFEDGQPGKKIIFNMEERQRIKIVDYAGSKKVDASTIESKERDAGVQIRLDSFVDQSMIRKVAGLIHDLYAEKGYQYAVVTPKVAPMVGESNTKLVHLTFDVAEGPQVQIGKIQFMGNKAFSNGDLEGQMKDNKLRGFFSFITGGGAYQEAKFADDAEKITEFYRDHGYIRAQVGAPTLETLSDSKDGKIRYVRMKIPVDEGPKYKIAKLDFSGNTVVKTEALRPMFNIKSGDYFSEKNFRKGHDKVQEGYGTMGYFELTMVPEFEFSDIDKDGKPTGSKDPPTVNLTIHIEEGVQYFVNRITFAGNTTTHDSVIRRELRVYEDNIFNTEALKYSVKRLNQLGYFKPLEKQEDFKVDKTPGTDNKVDINLKFAEQNRNQLTFGAGVSQLEGFFGQLSFQTANFLGRGETVAVTAQDGTLARNYQLSFTEPFLFDRPITSGFDLYSRQLNYLDQFTQTSVGGTLTFGFPLADFTRMYLGYGYEDIKISNINPAYITPLVLASNPYLRDSLLINQNGERRIGKISPSLQNNTVAQPIFPTSGHKYTAGFDFAGVGGDTQFWSSTLEALWYVPLSKRTSLGIRVQSQYIRPYGNTKDLPIFQKIFLGGDYTIRGFDMRTVGPHDAATNLVVGGNKSILFNAEYVVNVGGPVRVLAFADVGQVRDVGQRFAMRTPTYSVTAPTTLLPFFYDPLAPVAFGPPISVSPTSIVTQNGTTSAFDSSIGLEVRFFMPVLNVPFRLIMADNPQRGGVLNQNGLFTAHFVFKFAVGTTF
jgi:outer membrane protein insertion porin family